MDPREAIYEQLLVLRSQGGDDAAFEELVDRYNRRLSYFLRKMLRDRDCADDALQEVWMDVYRGIRRMTDTRGFGPWVYRISRMRAFRELRRRGLPVEPIVEEVTAAEDESFTPEDAAAIHRGLDEISPEHREVLLLRFVEDMSYEQIANVVDCSVGTVRSRLHYAKLALRAILERSINHERK